MIYNEDEIPKHKKKLRKTTKKSNHKHTYTKCILFELKGNTYYLSEYCTVCGKLGTISLGIKDIITNKTIIPSTQYLLSNYPNLEIKEVQNIFDDKFV